MIYYKLVSKSLKSAVQKTTPLEVQYKINEWVKPIYPRSCLMCFDSMKRARGFRIREQEEKKLFLYTCEIKKYRGVPRFFDWHDPLQQLDKLQQRIKQKIKYKDWIQAVSGYPPLGTVFASQIKLLELLTYGEN